MTNQNDHIINETLRSLDGIQRAEASPFLYGRIMQRMKEQLPAPVYYTGKAVIQFALAAMVVASLNIISVKSLRSAQKPKIMSDEVELQRMAQEYFGFENTNNYMY